MTNILWWNNIIKHSDEIMWNLIDKYKPFGVSLLLIDSERWTFILRQSYKVWLTHVLCGKKNDSNSASNLFWNRRHSINRIDNGPIKIWLHVVEWKSIRFYAFIQFKVSFSQMKTHVWMTHVEQDSNWQYNIAQEKIQTIPNGQSEAVTEMRRLQLCRRE